MPAILDSNIAIGSQHQQINMDRNNNNQPSVLVTIDEEVADKNANNKRARSRSNSTAAPAKRPEDEMPLSFASFYYSLKVIKGKGTLRKIFYICKNSLSYGWSIWLVLFCNFFL